MNEIIPNSISKREIFRKIDFFNSIDLYDTIEIVSGKTFYYDITEKKLKGQMTLDVFFHLNI